MSSNSLLGFVLLGTDSSAEHFGQALFWLLIAVVCWVIYKKSMDANKK